MPGTETCLDLTVDGGLGTLEEERDPVGREHVDGARRELGAMDLAPRGAQVVGLDDDGRRRRRPRVQPQRDARDQPEPPARAGEELAEVVAGDVLHDLAARARDRAVGEDDGDPDHEVAHRAVAVAARPREVGGEAGADRRVARRVERQHLPVRPERRLQFGERQPGLDDRRQVARLVLEDSVQPCRDICELCRKLLGGYLLFRLGHRSPLAASPLDEARRDRHGDDRNERDGLQHEDRPDNQWDQRKFKRRVMPVIHRGPRYTSRRSKTRMARISRTDE